MKTLKITLAIIAILIVVFIVLITVFLNTFDISRLKAQIVNQLSIALDRVVDIDDIQLNLSFQKGTVLNIKGIKVSDDMKFSDKDFLTVDNIYLAVDLNTLIQERKLVVSSAEISSPKIRIIRNEAGQWNIPGMPSPPGEADQTEEDKETKDNPKPPAKKKIPRAQQSQPDWANFIVKTITLEDGELFYVDQSRGSKNPLNVSRIKLKVTEFSLTEPFQFSLSGFLDEGKNNIELSGKTHLNMKDEQVRLDDVEFLAKVSRDAAGDFLPQDSPLLNRQIIEDWRGKVQINISQVVLGRQGVLVLSLLGKVSEGLVRVKGVRVPIEHIDIAFGMNESDLEISRISFVFGSGAVRGEGRIDDYLKQQAFNFSLRAEKVTLGEVVPYFNLPFKFQGDLYFQQEIMGEGLTGENLLNSLVGTGSVEVKEGRLVDINILRTVLNKISMIPNLLDKIERNLPMKHQKNLERQDTLFNKIRLNTNIRDGGVTVSNTEIEADSFLLSGHGRYGFDQNVYFDVSVTIPQNLSRAMIGPAPELKFLLDQYGQIFIPLSPYEGPVSQIRILPDLEYLGKKIIVNRGKQELQRLLDDVLDREETRTNNGQTEDPEGQLPGEGTPGQEKPIEEELIDTILDKIFQ